MLLNLSNHPSAQWPAAQKEMALQHYGSVMDMAFPAIDPAAGHDDIAALAGEYALRCSEVLAANEETGFANAVHIMGELTFCYCLVVMLQKEGIMCVASTTRRVAKENEKGEKTSLFSFVTFRLYPLTAHR